MDNRIRNIVKLNILQWNCRSLVPKLKIFESLLIQEKIHIAAICETWLNSDNNLNIKNYNVFRQDRINSFGGVAILSHKSILACKTNYNTSNNDIEVVGVKILNCDQIRYIYSVYCPSDARTTQYDWDHLLSFCDTKTLILGDFNAHHVDWSYKTDTRGTQLYNSIVDSNFITLNDGNATRLQLVQGVLHKTSPDLSLVSSDIPFNFDWSVTNESLGSDHLIIKLCTSIQFNMNFIKKRNFKLANWHGYRTYIKTLFTNFIFTDNIQQDYNNFIDLINKAAEKFIPFFKYCPIPTTKFTPKSYWTPELSRAVAIRRIALRNFRRNPTPRNYEILKEKIRSFQKHLRRAQIESWHKFCTSIGESTSSLDMWNQMRWIKGYKMQKINIDDTMATNLLRNLCPDFVCRKSPIFSSSNQQLESSITVNELRSCIKSKDTAPGHDNISYSMVKYLSSNALIVLIDIYNRILTNGFIPKQWRSISVIPIPKPGRDISNAGALRPISLISCLCKIFHSILHKRLEWYIENNNVLLPNTVGFRKMRSTLDCLSVLVSSTQLNFTKNLFTIACFVDLDNAYNNLDIYSLVKILDNLGIGSIMCNYIWNILSERYLQINVNNVIVSRRTCQGIAQGDPLSPLLFNIATSNICKTMNNINFLQYADDFVLYTSCFNINEGESVMQMAVNKFYNCISDIGMKISTSKSKITVFKKGINRFPVKIYINGKMLEVVENVKYLGCWLDRSLRWSKQINELQGKILKFLNVFKVLAGSGWGVHPKHLRRIYLSSIRSRLDYASFLVDDSSEAHLKKLDLLQNKALRIIGGYVRTTPTHVMESDLGIQPLHFRRFYLCGKFLLRSKSFKFCDTIQILENSIRSDVLYKWKRKRKPLLLKIHEQFRYLEVNQNNKFHFFSFDTWINNLTVENVIKINIDNFNKPKKTYDIDFLGNHCQQFISNNYNGFYRIFTDGSKEGNSSGAAFYDDQNSEFMKFQISQNISIMHTELLAICEALSYISSVNHNKFVIFSDSKSSLQHIARCTSNPKGIPVAFNILKLIHRYDQQNKLIVLQWIPSHVNISGNEIADALAKEGITDGLPMAIEPVFSDCVYLIRNLCNTFWKEYFDQQSQTKGIWYRTIQAEPSIKSWIDTVCLNRKDCVTCLRLRSGHIPSNKFAFLMKKINNPNCSACNTLDDVYHVMMECVQNEPMRRRLLIGRDNSVGACNSVLAVPDSELAKKLFYIVQKRNN